MWWGVAMFSPPPTSLDYAAMFPPLKTVYKGSAWGRKAPHPMPPALICKQTLKLYSQHSGCVAHKRATGPSDGALFAELSAASPHKSCLRDVTPGLQIRALNHSGALQRSVFLKIL